MVDCTVIKWPDSKPMSFEFITLFDAGKTVVMSLPISDNIIDSKKVKRNLPKRSKSIRHAIKQ